MATFFQLNFQLKLVERSSAKFNYYGRNPDFSFFGEFCSTIGYLNDGKGELVIDEDLVQYVKRIFKLYATGDYTMKELSDLMYKEGFRSRGRQ